MDRKQKQKRNRVFGILIAIPLVVVMVYSTSCSPRHLVEYRDRYVHDTTYVSKVEKHTEYVRDSIFVKEKGDTVYQYVERWRYRDRYIHDTVSHTRVDTLVVRDTITEYVDKPMNKWQAFRLWLGNIALVAGLALGGWWVFRKVRNWR